MEEYNFTATEAKREAVPPLIALMGGTGSGKTLSALKLARGIVGVGGKIIVMDTENGRAKFYSEQVGGWIHVDVQPPFTPEKYSAGFKFCEAQKGDVIIVDSASHVWEGEGGVIDIANNARTKAGKEMQGLAKWNKPKMAHKKMMNSLIRSALPVIFCLRNKEIMEQVGSGYNAQIVSKGFKPICEKNFIFEMTVALHLTEDGYYDLNQSKKIMEGLKDVFTPNTQINESMGAKLASWLGGGEAVDSELIILKRDGQEAAYCGEETYVIWKDKLTLAQKAKIRPFHSDWAKTAKGAGRGSVDSSENENTAQNLID